MTKLSPKNWSVMASDAMTHSGIMASVAKRIQTLVKGRTYRVVT